MNNLGLAFGAGIGGVLGYIRASNGVDSRFKATAKGTAFGLAIGSIFESAVRFAPNAPIVLDSVRNYVPLAAKSLSAYVASNLPFVMATAVVVSFATAFLIRSCSVRKKQINVLENATLLKSDYYIVRKMVSIWSSFININIAGFRPVLSLGSRFKLSFAAYRRELIAISQLSEDEKEKIRNDTHVYKAETQSQYENFISSFNINAREQPTQICWQDSRYSNSLLAAREFKEVNPTAKIAITNFANAVRVGGADSCGGKGSQEESLFRSTFLRVSLESAYEKADPKVQALTGRYIEYYGAILSENVPSIDNKEEKFGYISASAPDLRTGIRSEGAYYNQLNPVAKDDLVRKVLRRKLSVVMMAAAAKGYNVLVLGAFGCGAFGNKPEMVAEVTKDLLQDRLFKNVFSHVIIPIGSSDPNAMKFKTILPAGPLAEVSSITK